MYSVSLDSNNFSDGIRETLAGDPPSGSKDKLNRLSQTFRHLLLSPTLPVSTWDFKPIGNETLAITFDNRGKFTRR